MTLTKKNGLKDKAKSNKEMAKVSVIIPVYNTEKYLSEALDSIVNQTLQDIEIITINDGSKDNSLQILNTYAQRDKRIKVFSQQNQGLSATRNVGINKAIGKYIYFFDSDDILAPMALEKCFDKCEAENLNFCIFDADIFYDDDSIDKLMFDYQRCGLLKDKIYSGKEIMRELLPIGKFRASSCLYLINLSYLRGLNLYYEHIIQEDELFSFILYIQAEKVGVIAETFFHRRVRKQSIMTVSYSSKNLNSYFFTVDKMIAFPAKDKATKDIVKSSCKNIVSVAVYRANVLDFATRLWCLQRVLSKYWRFCSAKSLLVCAFPFLIRHTK